MSERAFPSSPHYQKLGLTEHFYEGSYGMTLRDYFAAKALPEAIRHHLAVRDDRIQPAEFDYDRVALSSYVMADAMLKAREQ